MTPRTILDDLFNHAPSLTSEDDCTEIIVIPLLIRTGFAPSQIRRKVSITRQGSQGSCKQADIVIYSDGRPMMVVEIKRLGHRLTEEDSNQALAYTQLLNPAALFAVLTNGRDWEVYRLDRDEIGGLDDLAALLGAKRPGDQVEITVLRMGKPIVLTARLQSRS